jgi:hypothetical protein
VTVEPARTYTVGHQPTSRGSRDIEPAHEEIVGTNWFEAAQRLDTLMRDWANDDDKARARREPFREVTWTSAERVDTKLRELPPVYPHDARYEITTPDSLVRVFYLTSEPA